ncbi:hypothetical protein L9F63_008809, partial [Diploptera punctata]
NRDISIDFFMSNYVIFVLLLNLVYGCVLLVYMNSFDVFIICLVFFYDGGRFFKDILYLRLKFICGVFINLSNVTVIGF